MITFNYILRTEKIVVLFPYDPTTAAEVKNMGAYAHYEITPTKTFNGVENIKKFKHWQMDLTANVIENLNKIRDNKNYQIDSLIFAAWETKQASLIKNLELSRALETDFKLQPRWEHLQNKIPGFQMAAIEYMRLNPRGVFLADENYLNPQLETLLAIETGEMYPVLILCPIQNKFTWAGKLKRHFPHQKFEILDENKLGIDEFTTVAIVAYPQFQTLADILTIVNWRTVILDDYRHINDHAEPRTKAIIEFTKNIPLKMILSNGLDLARPEKMLTALILTDYIKNFGGFFSFVNKYCEAKKGAHGWNFSGAAHLAELEQKLRELFVIGRTKAQIEEEVKKELKLF